MWPKRRDKSFAGWACLLLALMGCQGVTGMAGEIPIAGAHDGRRAWILAYSAEPRDAAATQVEWRLYEFTQATKRLAWAAPGMQPEGSPALVSAQLVTQPSAPPVAWVAARYPGGQYRIHRFASNQTQFWAIQGERVPPDMAGLHVTESPDGATWVTFSQPRYRRVGEPARELFELRPNGKARALRESALWAHCTGAACTVLYETDRALVVERNGVPSVVFETGRRFSAPLRAVCAGPQGEPVLITEERAYPLEDRPAWPLATLVEHGFTQLADGSLQLPEEIRRRLTSYLGRLLCDNPAAWLWISDTEKATYEIVFTTGTATRIREDLPATPSLVAYADADSWVLVGARYEETESYSCDSPRELIRTCLGDYDRYSMAVVPASATSFARVPSRR